MTEGDDIVKPGVITEMTVDQIGKIILGGLIAGAITGGLTLFFSTFVFRVLPCSGDTCGSGGQYAAVLAGIISAAFGLFWLMRIQAFRPLLIVIAVTISLWGIGLSMLHWPWYAIVGIAAVLHAFAYGLFAWLSRIRLFWIVIVLLVALVFVVRLVLAT